MKLGRWVAVVALAGLWLLTACRGSEEPLAPEPVFVFEDELGDDVVPIVSFHTRYGFPGPWSRERGRQADFERDSRSCLRRSNEARKEVAVDDRNDAAYRGFLQCMEELGWSRGTKKKPADGADDPAAPATAS